MQKNTQENWKERFDTTDFYHIKWQDSLEKIKSFIEDVVTLTRIKIIHGTQKKISDLPDTCPANESDEFDSGMRKMKDNVLSIIKEMQNHG